MLQFAQIRIIRNFYRSLLLIIARATRKELARQVRYLKVENHILRSKLPARVPVTEKEKNRLLRFRCSHGTYRIEVQTRTEWLTPQRSRTSEGET